jgi:hypothetical protein
MSARKMLVIYLAATHAVLGVATRKRAGAPPLADLVGDALIARSALVGDIAVPADVLAVKEVDYSEEVIRQPLLHGLDQNGVAVPAPSSVTALTATSAVLTLTLGSAASADKAVLVVIDGGVGQGALRFGAKTLASTTVSVPISGVSPGAHVVLASVDGFAPLLASATFT